MSEIIVLGAGPIGATTAILYAERGDRVTLVTRSGTGPELPGIDRVPMDATDTGLHELAAGAEVIVNAINLPYEQWESGWPPIHRSVLAAAESSGAVLALVGNLYGYPAGTSPMTPEVPLAPPSRKGAVRARMWADLLAAHAAGRVRGLEVRASDYLGHQVTSPMGAHAGPRLVDPVLQGRRAWVIGNPDAPHTWTAVDDIARTVVTLAGDERAWGRAWHAPSESPRTLREVARDIAAEAGVPEVAVTQIPRWVLRLGGLVQPVLREMLEVAYQHDAPFVASHDETTALFGVQPTPWAATIAAIVAARVPEALGAAGRPRVDRSS